MKAGQGDDSAAPSVCQFWELSRIRRQVGVMGGVGGEVPLGDRAEACASDTLNADYVTLYTAPPEFRGSGSFILWIL